MIRALRVLLLSITLMISVSSISYATTGNEILESMSEGAPSESEIDENYDAAKKQTEQIYYNALDELSDEEGPLNVPFTKWLYIKFYRFYYTLKDAAPYVCAISFALGILMMTVSRQNKRIQKFALLYLVILIPLAMIFIVFAVGMTPLFKSK